MAVTARRRLETTNTRRFGSGREAYAIPDLTEIQTKSYARFLQYETPQDKRKAEGLEGVLKEIFPIESYDKKLSLSYLRYELGKPRYEPDASQPRYRLRFRNGSGRTPAVQLPRHSGARKLDRNQHDEEGKHHRSDRPERQVLGDYTTAGDGSAVRAGCRYFANVLRND